MYEIMYEISYEIMYDSKLIVRLLKNAMNGVFLVPTVFLFKSRLVILDDLYIYVKSI